MSQKKITSSLKIKNKYHTQILENQKEKKRRAMLLLRREREREREREKEKGQQGNVTAREEKKNEIKAT